MKLAVNYSSPAADLLRDGQVRFDCFKCPAWPDLVATVKEIHPTYVHFPLKIGVGNGDAIDTETNQPADWSKVELLVAQTDTPFVNVHLAPTVQDYPDVPVDTTDFTYIEMLIENILKDLRAVVNRFGSNRVIVENVPNFGMGTLRPAILPEVIRHVVEEAGCGFLLDLSHARLAAQHLGIDERKYVSALPTSRIREIHITGIQRFEGRWVELARQAGVETKVIHQFAGRLVEHLPMTREDWDFFTWSMEQVHLGAWSQPWVVAYEYGGVGRLHEIVTETKVLADQIPRLDILIKEVQ